MISSLLLLFLFVGDGGITPPVMDGCDAAKFAVAVAVAVAASDDNDDEDPGSL
jgi:hypothetical protein